MKKLFFTMVMAFCFAVQGFGQEVKDLNKLKKEYPKLQNANTSDNFIAYLKDQNSSKLEALLIKSIDLYQVNLKPENINPQEETLELNKIYYLNGLTKVKVNIEKAKVYVLHNKDKTKKLFFYIKGGVFLTEGSLSTEEEISYLINMKETIADIEYNCGNDGSKIISVHPHVLSENLVAIKKAVILNSSDNITDNTAISFTNGSNDAKISVGANLNKGKRLFFNVGVYTSATNAGVLYSEKSWKNNTGAIFTVNRIIGKETQFSKPSDCRDLTTKRSEYLESVYNEFKDLHQDYTGKMKRITKIDSILKTEKEYEKKDKLKKEKEELVKTTKHYQEIIEDANKYIESKVIEFDKKNDILTGSKLHWIKASVNLFNENISLDSLQLYTGTVIGNYPRLSTNLSYNFNYNKNKKLLNFQAFTNVIMGNLLDANINNKTPYLLNIEETTYIFDQSGTQLGRYSDLKKTFWTSQTGVQATWFFVENFGVSGYASHTFALQKEEFTEYKNRYSLLAGFAFKVNNDKDVNKATFRLLGGFENQSYNTNAFDNFSVKVSMGIPFNLFTKKEI